MGHLNTMISPTEHGKELTKLIAELEKSRNEELQRLQVMHFERIRHLESARLRAEKNLESQEEKYAELDELYRAEVVRLNSDLERIREEMNEASRSCVDLEMKLDRAESSRDSLDQERRALLERLNAEQVANLEARRKQEEEKKELAGRLAGVEGELSLSVDERQKLELQQARLGERLVGLESLRDSLDQERRALLERLNAEQVANLEARRKQEEEKKELAGRLARVEAELSLSVDERQKLELQQARLGERLLGLESLRDNLEQERQLLIERLDVEQLAHLEASRKQEEKNRELADQLKKAEDERIFFQKAMVAAEKRLYRTETKFLHQARQGMLRGLSSWKELARLPGTLWRTWRTYLAERRASSNEMLKQIESIFATQGSKAAENLIREIAIDPVELASGLTRLARLIVPSDSAMALILAKEAVHADPRPFRRKWLAFMLFDAGFIDAAHELLTTLPAGTEFKSSERNKAEYIQGCHRLLHGSLPPPESNAAPDYAPVKGRRLYIAASSLPYHVTGYTLRTHALLQALNRQGADVICLTRPGYPEDRTDGQNADRAGPREIDGVRYEPLPGPHRRKLGLDQYLLKSAEILVEKARTEKAEIIHAASNYEAALPALIAARKLGIPFVYEVRGLWEFTSASKKTGWEGTERFALERQLETLTAKYADRVLTLTQALADELVARGVDQSRISLAPNAVDIQAFGARPMNSGLAASLSIEADDFVVGYVGSVLAYEGLDDLIEAIALLRHRLPQVRALIVGDGDALPALRQLAQERGLLERMVFCGKIAPDLVPGYYALMNAIVLPRKPVTVCQLVSPLKPLEAMAMEVPLIVSDVAALREMVKDGETALVHIAGNARSLADCIEVLAKEPGVSRRLASNARKEVAATRTWQQVAATIANVHRNLATPGSGKSNLPQSVEDLPDLTPILLPPGKNALDELEKKLLDQKLGLALRQGKQPLHRLLVAQCEGRSPKFSAFCLLRAAQICLEAGEEVEAMRLAEEALVKDAAVTSLRSAARVFYNAASLERAVMLVDQLERGLGEPKPNDRKFIDEVRGRAQLAAWAALPAQERTLPVIPKRVLNILAFSLPYTSVGYATRSHGLARGIKNAGWDIRPYTRPGFPYDFKPELEGKALPEQDEIDGIVYRRIFDFNRKDMNEVEYLHAAIAHYERIIREEMPQVVHAASNYVTALPALIAARRLGVPFIYEVRGFWEVTRSSRDEQFEHTAKYRFMQLFEGLTARHADHVITITTAMKEELMARGVPEARIAIAYNSVDPERFVPRPPNMELAASLGIPASVPVIGYVGSFVDYEGLDDLVTACCGLMHEGIEFRLLLVGDGAVFDDLKRQIEETGLAEKTILTGRVPHEMVEDYYSLIDIAPFPRKPWEVCELVSPLKPYEAMALEKAVVVSSTRALKEIVSHEQNGLVFAKGDLADLQDKLANIITNPAQRAALGKTARCWICQERSWDAAGHEVGKMFDLLSHLIGPPIK